jgi:hypothetical protein
MSAGDSEAGLTLIELLVASTMSVVLVGAIGSMLVSTLRSQPQINERAQSVSTARWVMERLTREIRNGVVVDKATASTVSLRTYVRHTVCGGTSLPASTQPAIVCQVTYKCTTESCSRIEAAPGVETGTETTIFSGIDDSQVFTYAPSAEEPTYVGVTLRIPNPTGSGDLTVTDGASLRNATLSN